MKLDFVLSKLQISIWKDRAHCSNIQRFWDTPPTKYIHVHLKICTAVMYPFKINHDGTCTLPEC